MKTLPLALLALAALAAPAFALFEVKEPLSKMAAGGSSAVFAATITSYNADNHVLAAKPSTTFKGPELTADSLQIQLEAPESLRSQIKIGQPLVIFKSNPPPPGHVQSIAVHIADHWYAGQALAKPNQFRINTALGLAAHTAHDETFPGTTAELIQALAEIKTGKSTLLDAFPDLKIPAPQKIAVQLPAHATAFAALQWPGDPKTTLFFVATKNKFQALALKPDNTLEDRTAALKLEKLRPTLLAAGATSKTALLLADHDLYSFTNAGHVKATLDFPKQPVLAACIIADPPALMLLSPMGIHRAQLSLDDPAKILLNDEDTRLTGTRLTDYHRPHEKGFTSASLAALDINADSRPDLLLLTPEGTLTLLNRGFGGYLVNKDLANPLLNPANSAQPTLPLIAATASTLWLLQPDGTLTQYTFPTK